MILIVCNSYEYQRAAITFLVDIPVTLIPIKMTHNYLFPLLRKIGLISQFYTVWQSSSKNKFHEMMEIVREKWCRKKWYSCSDVKQQNTDYNMILMLIYFFEKKLKCKYWPLMVKWYWYFLSFNSNWTLSPVWITRIRASKRQEVKLYCVICASFNFANITVAIGKTSKWHNGVFGVIHLLLLSQAF